MVAADPILFVRILVPTPTRAPASLGFGALPAPVARVSDRDFALYDHSHHIMQLTLSVAPGHTKLLHRQHRITASAQRALAETIVPDLPRHKTAALHLSTQAAVLLRAHPSQPDITPHLNQARLRLELVRPSVRLDRLVTAVLLRSAVRLTSRMWLGKRPANHASLVLLD